MSHLTHNASVDHFGDESIQAIDCTDTDNQTITNRKYNKHKMNDPSFGESTRGTGKTNNVKGKKARRRGKWMENEGRKGKERDKVSYQPILFLTSISAVKQLTLKIVSEMTYNASSGTLNRTISHHSREVLFTNHHHLLLLSDAWLKSAWLACAASVGRATAAAGPQCTATTATC